MPNKKWPPPPKGLSVDSVSGTSTFGEAGTLGSGGTTLQEGTWGQSKPKKSMLDVPKLTCGMCEMVIHKIQLPMGHLVGTSMILHVRKAHGESLIDAHMMAIAMIEAQYPELKPLEVEAPPVVEKGVKGAYNWAMGMYEYEEPKKVAECRTQKARGVAALKEWGWDVPDVRVAKVEELEEWLEHVAVSMKLVDWLGRFVRPCPVRPRHGFVESRVVGTVEELGQLVKETKEADGEAELMAMPLVQAEYGGVWTEGRLVVGRGREGATAGKECVVLPALGDLLAEWGPDRAGWVRRDAGISEGSYVELLWRKQTEEERRGTAYLHSSPTWRRVYVQLRNGPRLEGVGVGDWVPEQTVVREVVKVEGQDLLEWERVIGQARGRGGVCVWHPGGSLASHYAVHAVLAGVPVIVSAEPVVGQVLNRTVGSERKRVDFAELRKGFAAGLVKEMTYLDAALVMLAGAHHAGVWMGQCDRALGLAMGAGVRLTITACLGEGRHWKRSDRGGGGIGGGEGEDTRGRNAVYREAWGQVVEGKTLDAFELAMDRFLRSPLWPSTSHGGFKWYRLGLAGVELWNTVVEGEVQGDELAKERAKEQGWGPGEQAVDWFNQLVHAVHNGGWAFNKYLDGVEMNRAANLPVQALVRAAADYWGGLQEGVGSAVEWRELRALGTLGRVELAVAHEQCAMCGQWGHTRSTCEFVLCEKCVLYVKPGEHDCPAVCKTCGGQNWVERAGRGEGCAECLPSAEELDLLGVGKVGAKHRVAKYGPGMLTNERSKMLCRVCELPYNVHVWTGVRCVWTKDGARIWNSKVTREGLSRAELGKQRKGKCRWWEPGAYEKWMQERGTQEQQLQKTYEELKPVLEASILKPLKPKVPSLAQAVDKTQSALETAMLKTPKKISSQADMDTAYKELAAALDNPKANHPPFSSATPSVATALGMSGTVVRAQATLRKGMMVHVQFKLEGMSVYGTKDVYLKDCAKEGTPYPKLLVEWGKWIEGRVSHLSMADTQTQYWDLDKKGDGWYVGEKCVLPLVVGQVEVAKEVQDVQF